jgi:hypothetical protein
MLSVHPKKKVRKKIKFSSCLLLIIYNLLLCSSLFANTSFQKDTSTQKVYKIAVFAPLYLDSVFTENKLRSETSLPKFIMPSVEFVQGAEIAFDSLATTGQRIEAFIYDSKSYKEPLLPLLHSSKLDSFDLIIGAVKDVDYKVLADFAESRSIPFISATFPNDGGITNNPFVTILNSTLKAHCEGIYSYILQSHGTDKIYLIKKPGAQEDKIAGFLKALNEQEGKPLLNIQTISFDSSFSANALKKKLDSNRNSVIIGGSLDEDFAKNLADVCFNAKENYPLTLIGMPNWDGFKSFAKEDAYKDFPIHFTSPYYNSRTSAFSNYLTDEYNLRYKAKPTDNACKGFESAYYFTSLVLKYPHDVMAHLNDSPVKVFNEFNFKPVLATKTSIIPDYYENKHLYIMRIFNGTVSRDW